MQPEETLDQLNGHFIYSYNDTDWYYLDDQSIVNFDKPRHCKHCGKLPTKEGYDGCLGKLKDVKFACCGHGVENWIDQYPYIIFNIDEEVRFNSTEDLLNYVEENNLMH